MSLQRAIAMPVVLLAIGAHAAAQEDPNPRRELERMERALAEAVSRVSRPATVSVLGAADSCRGYRLQGVGAWFVVSPRSLPERLAARAGSDLDLVKADHALATAISGLEQGVGEAASEEDKATLRGGVQQLKARRRQLRAYAQAASERERELKAWEERARATHQAAEEARLEAEQALRMVEGMLGRSSADPSAQRVAGHDESVPMPPWRSWVHSEPPQDTRPPDVLLHDVREAVTETLEEHGAALGLRSEEMIAVAVDFFRPSPLAAASAPTRTLVVRVPKRVLEMRHSGRLSAEEARRQFEIVEY